MDTGTGLTGWLEIFKSGTHTDSKGVDRTFTNADLELIVNNSWSSLPIPHVITHQELYSPFAYAQAVELCREGDSIYARNANIEPQFEKLVKEGRLYSRSVRLMPVENGWKITHIAWLGAEPPAVEGLAPVQFSSANTSIDFSFNAYKPEKIVVSDKGSGGAGFTQADIDAAKEAAKREAAADFSREKAKLEAELKVERDNQRKVIWKGRIDAAIREGRLTPAQAEGMAEFALGLPVDAIEFSRGGDKPETVKTTGEQWFIDFMARLPKQVAMAADGGGSDANDAMDIGDADAIARAAVEYQAAMQAKGIVIGASAAVAHVTKGGKA